MRPIIVFAALFGGAATGVAQDADLYAAHSIRFHDGRGESFWKVSMPSGPSDWFNVDFDGALDGALVVQLHCASHDLGGFAGAHAELGIYPEGSVFPNAPDIANPIVVRSSPAVPASSRGPRELAYIVPKTTVPAGDYHLALHFAAGDSHLWCGRDRNETLEQRSYFTAANYSTGAVPLTCGNWMLSAGTYEETRPGTLLVNGSTSAVSELDYENVCLTFFGPTLNTPSILYLCLGGTPSLQLLPAGFTITDGAFAGPCPQTWQICTRLDCNTPTTPDLEFCAIYIDLSDLKPSGKPKVKLGSSAHLSLFVGNNSCILGGGSSSCFGRRDDCVMDGRIWKVQNPSGPSDWFNVNHGSVPSRCLDLTGVSISSWDFCGFGPCWAEVGIYPADSAIDPSGGTPDVNNPAATVSGTSACMAPGAGDWGCPLTYYDTPDFEASTTTRYHVAAKWPAGDSCMWLGSDTDGKDSSCSPPIPNNGVLSLFSSNGYSSPAVPMTSANWMMRIDWTWR